jgi:mono/diheme cytochrome c family protein
MMNSIWCIAASGGALVLAAGLASPQGPIHDEAPSAADIAEAGELFANQCASCHLPPDPGFEVDRAWLSQVKDTA